MHTQRPSRGSWTLRILISTSGWLGSQPGHRSSNPLFWLLAKRLLLTAEKWLILFSPSVPTSTQSRVELLHVAQEGRKQVLAKTDRTSTTTASSAATEALVSNRAHPSTMGQGLTGPTPTTGKTMDTEATLEVTGQDPPMEVATLATEIVIQDHPVGKD